MRLFPLSLEKIIPQGPEGHKTWLIHSAGKEWQNEEDAEENEDDDDDDDEDDDDEEELYCL